MGKDIIYISFAANRAVYMGFIVAGADNSFPKKIV